MAQRGRQPNNEGTGASKKNKSIQKQSQTEGTTVQKKVSGNQDQPKQRNSKNQGKAAKKTAIHGQITKTKRYPPYKPNQIGDRTNQVARKKHHGVSQEKSKTPIWIHCQPIIIKPPQCLQCSCQYPNMVLLLPPIPPRIP